MDIDCLMYRTKTCPKRKRKNDQSRHHGPTRYHRIEKRQNRSRAVRDRPRPKRDEWKWPRNGFQGRPRSRRKKDVPSLHEDAQAVRDRPSRTRTGIERIRGLAPSHRNHCVPAHPMIIDASVHVLLNLNLANSLNHPKPETANVPRRPTRKRPNP